MVSTLIHRDAGPIFQERNDFDPLLVWWRSARSLKIRRPDPTSGKGRSGGYRILYALLPAYGTVLLIAAWPKSEREDLEPEDYKAIGKIIARIQELLDHGKVI
jgi:hypothetical protein